MRLKRRLYFDYGLCDKIKFPIQNMIKKQHYYQLIRKQVF